MEGYRIPNSYPYEGMYFAQQSPEGTLEKIMAFETNIDDVCIASYPKSGTTWTQQIVSKIHEPICNPDKPLPWNIPHIELEVSVIARADNCGIGDALSLIKSRKSPRLFKTHLSSKYFRRQVEGNTLKVIFVVRNIRDVLVSYYHHYKSLPLFNFHGNFHDFFQLFRKGELLQGDILTKVQTWLDLTHLPNVLLLRYEDMKADLQGQMQRIAQFCGRPVSGIHLAALAEECSFNAMKRNAKANYFPGSQLVRKGMVGEWRKYFTEEESNYVDDVINRFPDYKRLYDDLDCAP